jgi:hypothetical protein
LKAEFCEPTIRTTGLLPDFGSFVIRISGDPADLLSGERGWCVSSSRCSLEMLVWNESPESSREISTGESRESRDPFMDEYFDE